VGEAAVFLEAMPGAIAAHHEHLKRQRLVIEIARRGGWRPSFELAVDPVSARSRSIDVMLVRPATNEIVVVEVWDWLADVGDASRSSGGRDGDCPASDLRSGGCDNRH
jgi:hypothetical protein